MCIIIYKPKGVEFPSETIISDCWESNPHGAGIAWSSKKKTFLKKGFMTYDHLDMFMLQIRNELIENDVIMHFRLATHGSIKPQNCHPFVVSNRIRDLRTLRYAGLDEIIVHNGIIPGIEFKSEKNDLSDTMLFTKKYHTLGVNHPEVQAILRQGKFVIMTPKTVTTYGHFVKDHNCYFSNTSYKPFVYMPHKTNGKGKNIIDWKDWEDYDSYEPDVDQTSGITPDYASPYNWQVCQYERTCLKDGYCVYSDRLVEDEIMEGDPDFCPLAHDYDLLDSSDFIESASNKRSKWQYLNY